MMMKSRYMTPGKIGSKMAPAEDNLGLTIPAFDEEVETRQKISEDAMRELRDENGRSVLLLFCLFHQSGLYGQSVILVYMIQYLKRF
jgi:hypothetical protein